MKCSISRCKSKAIQTISINFRERRNLCQYHYNLFQNREKDYKLTFERASNLKL